MRQADAIDQLTGALRQSRDPLWLRLRALMLERAVDPEKSLLVEFFLDDSALYFGIVVTQDRRAIQFDLDVSTNESADARLSSWEDITDSHTSPHSGLVETGLFRMEREGGTIL